MFVHGVWRDGKVGREWAHLRVEVERMVHFKVTEMTITGRIPDMPRAPTWRFRSTYYVFPPPEKNHAFSELGTCSIKLLDLGALPGDLCF